MRVRKPTSEATPPSGTRCIRQVVAPHTREGTYYSTITALNTLWTRSTHASQVNAFALSEYRRPHTRTNTVVVNNRL